MTKFKVGDIVEYVGTETKNMDGAIGRVFFKDEKSSTSNIHVEWFFFLGHQKSGCKYVVFPHSIRLVVSTETSNAPENQIPPPSPASSPASGRHTSSGVGRPSRPSGRRASVRSRK